ncbi:MAG: tetratricopeptide repeat protein [Terriglobia bacterium]
MRTKINLFMAVTAVICLITMVGGVAEALPANHDANPMAGVLNAMYNAEYCKAQLMLEGWLQSHPSDFQAWNYLAKTILDQEMLREGLFTGSAYLNGGKAFQKRREPLPSGFEDRLNAALGKAETLETARLREDPKDQEALYWLGATHATRAEYDFTLLRSYLAALHEGRLAWKTNRRLLKLNPHFIDAYFIAGIGEYTASLLPWYVKIVTSIAGVHGNRKRGIADLERVSKKGNYARIDARIVLVAIYEREKDYGDALSLIQQMGAAYPENFLAPLEMGEVYEQEGNWGKAAQVYDGGVTKFVDGKTERPCIPTALILYRAGRAHERMGETAKALALYGQAATDPGKSLTGYQAELAAANLDRHLGRRDEARKAYQRVADAVPNSDLGKAARAGLAELH